MKPEMIAAPDGLFMVDWDIVSVIVRSYVTADARLRHHHSHVEPGNWIDQPHVERIEVDHAAVSAERARSVPGLLAEIRQRGSRFGMCEQIGFLYTLEAETAEANDRLRRIVRDADARTRASLEGHLWRLDAAVETLRLIRDAAAGTILVTASSLSVPWALTTAGLAAGASGIFKYQDTGNVASAVLESTSEFTFALIPLGKAMTLSEKIYVALGFSTWTVSQGLIEGKSVAESVAQGVLRSTDPLVDLAIARGPVGRSLKRSVIPATTRVIRKSTPAWVVEEVAALGGTAYHTGTDWAMSHLFAGHEPAGHGAVGGFAGHAGSLVDTAVRRIGEGRAVCR